MFSLGELADRIGADLRGDPTCQISRLATLDNAVHGELTFLYDRRYRKFLKITGASAAIISPFDLADCPIAALVTEDPLLAYAKAVSILGPLDRIEPGIDPTAWIATDARIDPSAMVGPRTVVESGARIGTYTVVGAGCVIGREASLGDYTRLHANVTVCEQVTIGRRVVIHPGAVIGADGFGFVRDGEQWLKIPQIGSAQIGDDVEIGANTTIDRGALKNTVIEHGVKLDNQIQLGHNVHIGAHTVIAGCVGIAGGTRVGRHCRIGGGACIVGHIEIADDVTITGMSAVTKSITKSGAYSSTWAARESMQWRRRVALFNRLIKRPRKPEQI